MESYLFAVGRCSSCANGSDLAKLFNLNDKHSFDESLINASLDRSKLSRLYYPWSEMVFYHLNVLTQLSRNNYKTALDNQFKLVEIFSEYLQNAKDDNWFLPVMYVICVDLRSLAHTLDYGKEYKHHISEGEHLKKVTGVLMKLFRICVSDNRNNFEVSKKMGMMALSNQLFKIFFTISQLNLCKPLIVAIEGINQTDKFSISEKVTFNYYTGRKAIFEDNFQRANECLTFSFENCHRDYKNNKRLILIYLIPVKMALGILPTEELLEKYNLKEFQGIMSSVKRGHLSQLDKELSTHEAFFKSCGIYLILEKLKYIAYRNLFKITSQIIGSHMVPISSFTAALRCVGIEDVDIDETECLLANLIYENKIKGYIAHHQQKLVMSKTNAFPPIFQTIASVTR